MATTFLKMILSKFELCNISARMARRGKIKHISYTNRIQASAPM